MNDIKDVIKQRVREKEQKRKAQNGLLFIFLISSFLAFLTLFIYYGKQYHPDFKLNPYFHYSVILVFVSSLCIHLSYIFYKDDDLVKGFIGLIATILFTTAFAMLQVLGWERLKDTYIKGHALFANYIMFMILSVFHFLHILGGMIYLCIGIQKHLSYQIHSRDINFIKFACYFWHFLGSIWIIIFLLYK